MINQRINKTSLIKAFFLLFSLTLVLSCQKKESEEITENVKFIPISSLALSGVQDKITVFYLWASWCPACQAATPGLIDLYKEKIEGNPLFVFQTVSADKNSTDALAYGEEVDMPGWEIFLGPNQSLEVFNILGVTAVPTVFVIDARESTESPQTHTLSPEELGPYLDSI